MQFVGFVLKILLYSFRYPIWAGIALLNVNVSFRQFLFILVSIYMRSFAHKHAERHRVSLKTISSDIDFKFESQTSNYKKKTVQNISNFNGDGKKCPKIPPHVGRFRFDTSYMPLKRAGCQFHNPILSPCQLLSIFVWPDLRITARMLIAADFPLFLTVESALQKVEM